MAKIPLLEALKLLPGFFHLKTVRAEKHVPMHLDIERVPLPYEIPQAPVPLPQDLNLEALESAADPFAFRDGLQ